jgi:phosphoribosyl 1,2-cyclic phosphodiesterase
MTLKCIQTGSDGNSFILTNESDKHLMIEAGLPIGELKKGINFDVENWQGLVVSHGHSDHAMSVGKVRRMGIPVFLPYKFEAKRMRTQIGDFQVETFPVPHNGVENRGMIIDADGQKIAFMVDLEYCPYDLNKLPINILIVECNYIEDLVDDGIPNLRHKVLGHCELETTIGIIKNCQKHLRKVFLIHASKGVTMDKERAIKRIKEEIPESVECQFVRDGETYDISEIPF